MESLMPCSTCEKRSLILLPAGDKHLCHSCWEEWNHQQALLSGPLTTPMQGGAGTGAKLLADEDKKKWEKDLAEYIWGWSGL
jgi:hypothetical protein